MGRGPQGDGQGERAGGKGSQSCLSQEAHHHLGHGMVSAAL